MKILFFSQFYTPESIAPSFRATENSQIWSKIGNDVTVFTGYPNYPTGKVFDGYTPRMLSEESISGVRVLRSKLIAKPNTSMLKRLQNALSYFIFGWLNIHFRKKTIGTDYDIVLGTSGIVFNAILAQMFAANIHQPFVFELRDITYLQMQATGKKRTSTSVKIMRHIELMLCKKAKEVVVVTNGFKKFLIGEGVPEEKIHVITNGVDVRKAKNAYDEKRRLVLSYFGTLGISQDIKSTFEYAKTLSLLLDDFEYLIIGDGAQKSELEDEAATMDFIKMKPGMPASDLEDYYNITQLSVITLRKTDEFKYTIPSKLFQIMGRGVAVLFIGPDGECADIIREHNAGLALTGTKEQDLCALRQFFENENWRDILCQMGESGRRAVEQYYSRNKLAEEYINILNLARR